MKKILNIFVLFLLIASTIGSTINIYFIIKSRNYYKSDATITFVGLPDGAVHGNFVDSEGKSHIDAYLYTDIKLSEFFFIKKVSPKTIDKYIGKKITILFDSQTKDIINYNNMIKNTIFNIIIFIILVLKIKPCKRNNHQNSDHTKDAVQTGQR